MNMLQYKGYYGSVDLSVEDGILFGKLEFISALVNYEGETVSEIKSAFEEAVDDYLATCAEKNYEAEQPCEGSFNVRVGHDLHLAAALKAKEKGVSLNEFVRQTIADATSSTKKTRTEEALAHRGAVYMPSRARTDQRTSSSWVSIKTDGSPSKLASKRPDYLLSLDAPPPYHIKKRAFEGLELASKEEDLAPPSPFYSLLTRI